VNVHDLDLLQRR